MELEKISVTNVQDNNGSTGFQAIVTITDTLTGTVREHAVKTNRNGEGFWIDGQQCAGTCQFSVRSREAWRAAVRRWFKN